MLRDLTQCMTGIQFADSGAGEVPCTLRVSRRLDAETQHPVRVIADLRIRSQRQQRGLAHSIDGDRDFAQREGAHRPACAQRHRRAQFVCGLAPVETGIIDPDRIRRFPAGILRQGIHCREQPGQSQVRVRRRRRRQPEAEALVGPGALAGEPDAADRGARRRGNEQRAIRLQRREHGRAQGQVRQRDRHWLRDQRVAGEPYGQFDGDQRHALRREHQHDLRHHADVVRRQRRVAAGEQGLGLRLVQRDTADQCAATRREFGAQSENQPVAEPQAARQRDRGEFGHATQGQRNLERSGGERAGKPASLDRHAQPELGHGAVVEHATVQATVRGRQLQHRGVEAHTGAGPRLGDLSPQQQAPACHDGVGIEGKRGHARRLADPCQGFGGGPVPGRVDVDQQRILNRKVAQPRRALRKVRVRHRSARCRLNHRRLRT